MLEPQLPYSTLFRPATNHRLNFLSLLTSCSIFAFVTSFFRMLVVVFLFLIIFHLDVMGERPHWLYPSLAWWVRHTTVHSRWVRLVNWNNIFLADRALLPNIVPAVSEVPSHRSSRFHSGHQASLSTWRCYFFTHIPIINEPRRGGRGYPFELNHFSPFWAQPFLTDESSSLSWGELP